MSKLCPGDFSGDGLTRGDEPDAKRAIGLMREPVTWAPNRTKTLDLPSEPFCVLHHYFLGGHR